MEAWVVGAGVIGLTTGLRLLERGFTVKAISRQEVLQTTSVVAAAIWHPYRARDPRLDDWSRTSLRRYRELAAETPEAGVDELTIVEDVRPGTTPPAWTRFLPEFEPGPDRWRMRVARAEPLLFLEWLRGRFEALGGELHYLPAGVASLEALVDPGRIVVNCSGLGGRTLCADAGVRAVRGVVLRVRDPGLRDARLDERDENRPTYVIPRRHDCILGGTAEIDRECLDTDETLRREILDRCTALEPRLAGAEVLGHAAGLRPVRDRVRLEAARLDGGGPVIHNYGHGGSGFTVAFGCAEEVAHRAVAYRDGRDDEAFAPPPPLED